jgi:hypothetical protein
MAGAHSSGLFRLSSDGGRACAAPDHPKPGSRAVDGIDEIKPQASPAEKVRHRKDEGTAEPRASVVECVWQALARHRCGWPDGVLSPHHLLTTPSLDAAEKTEEWGRRGSRSVIPLSEPRLRPSVACTDSEPPLIGSGKESVVALNRWEIKELDEPRPPPKHFPGHRQKGGRLPNTCPFLALSAVACGSETKRLFL